MKRRLVESIELVELYLESVLVYFRDENVGVMGVGVGGG